MRVLICGSRTYDESYARFSMIYTILDGLRTGNGVVTIIQGCAKGADSQAAKWAEELGLDVESYPANWVKYNQGAGHIRNQQMLDEGKPDLVIAFVDKPLRYSHGTSNMVGRARQAKIPIYVVQKF